MTGTPRNGVELPDLTLGTWDIRTPAQAETAVGAAWASGYRGIDSAACYENEDVIRRAIDSCGIPRDGLTVTSKVWNDAHDEAAARAAFDASERRLGRIDIYLIHWPGPVPRFLKVWRALEELFEDGRTAGIGVSNFMVPQLEILLEHARIRPMLNQVECHLRFVDRPLLDFCRREGIAVQAFSPLGAGSGVLDDPVLREWADRLGVSPAQTALAYLRQLGIYPLPKSSNPDRIAENAGFRNVRIPDDGMAALAGRNRLVRTNKDPFGWFGQGYE